MNCLTLLLFPVSIPWAALRWSGTASWATHLATAVSTGPRVVPVTRARKWSLSLSIPLIEGLGERTLVESLLKAWHRLGRKDATLPCRTTTPSALTLTMECSLINLR